jgi:hypothetical protein
MFIDPPHRLVNIQTRDVKLHVSRLVPPLILDSVSLQDALDQLQVRELAQNGPLGCGQPPQVLLL